MPYENQEVPRRNRRRVLRAIGGGLGMSLSTFALVDEISRERGTDNTNGWLGNLLPADRTGTLKPKVHRDIHASNDTHFSIDERGAKAYEMGFVQVTTAGGLTHGQGDFSMDGAAWVESRWRPQESGQHRVIAQYNQSSDHWQDTMDTDADVVLTSEPHLAVINADTGQVVAHNSAIGSNAVSVAAQEYVIEQLLTQITKYILIPNLGFIGNIIASFILKEVFDHLIEIQPQNGQYSKYNRLPLTFHAKPDTTYHIRFTANNGFSGQTRDANDSFSAESSSLYELSRLHVEPLGFDSGIGSDESEVDGPPKPNGIFGIN